MFVHVCTCLLHNKHQIDCDYSQLIDEKAKKILFQIRVLLEYTDI